MAVPPPDPIIALAPVNLMRAPTNRVLSHWHPSQPLRIPLRCCDFDNYSLSFFFLDPCKADHKQIKEVFQQHDYSEIRNF